MGALAAVAAVLALWSCAPVVAVELDEGGVPTNRQAHLPRDVHVLGEEELCGSGGCWRVLTLGWPGHSSDELARRLGVGGGGDAERCRAVSWLDRRAVCVGVGAIVAPAPAAAPEQLKVQLRWDRPLGS